MILNKEVSVERVALILKQYDSLLTQ